MSPTRVAVVATHPLFGEGIARLLRLDSRLEVLRIDMQADDGGQQLKAFQPEVAVVEAAEDAAVWDALPGDCPRLYICVQMGGGTAQVYRERRVIHAKPEEIIEAIHQGTGGASPARSSDQGAANDAPDHPAGT